MNQAQPPSLSISQLFRSVPSVFSQWDISRYCALLAEKRNAMVHGEQWRKIRSYFLELSNLPVPPCTIDIGDVVKVSCAAGETCRVDRVVHSLARELIPWRKGPFEIFDLYIDAEWRSHKKWDRIKDSLGRLTNRRILDVGCSNGYYLFRMLEQDPELILGIDPSERFIFQFELLQHFIRHPSLFVEPLGIEDLGVFNGFFDVVLCMGVLYHRRNQLESLEALAKVIRPGGRLLLETLIVGDQTDYCLCPPERYSQMRNIWFIPSAKILTRWIQQVGFTSVEIVSDSCTSTEEQRQTEFAPYQSLSNFLNPEDPSLTVEGFPAPRRVAVVATRREG